MQTWFAFAFVLNVIVATSSVIVGDGFQVFISTVLALVMVVMFVNEGWERRKKQWDITHGTTNLTQNITHGRPLTDAEMTALRGRLTDR